ncbi:asparaginase [Mobilitalea sibirica]|uniref:Asparaginase n=1 Tax=Mobilitalea sibirica TaxID=1462919 RepID=A0A8J7H9J6_9FIRM|nr:asparaginase [Mobilitalea sibirica]MBH1941150.1 asparaginase [Mobilitalea sibirica]
MKRIHIFAMGGTISYLSNNKNRKRAEDLINEIGELPDHINITYEDLMQKASSDLLIDDVTFLAKAVMCKINEKIDGIVIVQGTDTMEETSFMLELLVDSKVPIVFTGALRHAGLRGSEGNANLFSAIIVASSEVFRNVGCVLVLNDEIHSSLYVKKMHTQRTGAFESQFGPIGYISEGHPRLTMIPRQINIDKTIFSGFFHWKPVPVFLAGMSLGDGGHILDFILQAGYKGMVIDGFGGGHVTNEFALKLPHIINEIPVVMSSRTGNGEVLRNTYRGYPGSEVELIKAGCIYAGIMDSLKARILLCLLVTCDFDRERIIEIFKIIGEP